MKLLALEEEKQTARDGAASDRDVNTQLFAALQEALGQGPDTAPQHSRKANANTPKPSMRRYQASFHRS